MTASQADTATRTGKHSNNDVLDVLIIGGGFSGLYALDRIRDLGFTAKVWDAAGGLGGIWWWNCYPGARTDSTGQIYQSRTKTCGRSTTSLNCIQGTTESEITSNMSIHNWISPATSCSTPSPSPAHGTRRPGSGPRVRGRQGAECASGDRRDRIRCQAAVSEPRGARLVRRRLLPHRSLAAGGRRHDGPQGRRHGHRSSGVQVVQEAGHVAEHVTVFQRTPNLAIPMQQRALTHDDNEQFRKGLPERFEARYKAFAGFDFDFLPQNAADLSMEERDAIYEKMWAEGGFEMWLGNFQDILVDEDANRTFYDFWRNKVLERVTDPKKAAIVAPETPPHPYGVKRPSLEQDYFDVINQSNVEVIDSNLTPIRRVLPHGIETDDGVIECDLLVLATGFDNNSGGIMAIDITGVDGLSIQDKWKSGVDTCMGLSTRGFPNMMFLYGPQSPSGFCNGPTSAEYQGEIVVEFLQHLRDNGITRFENTEESEKQWRAHVDELFVNSMFTKARSWYWGANVPGKPAQMLNYSGGVPQYFARWDEIKANGYAAFETN